MIMLRSSHEKLINEFRSLLEEERKRTVRLEDLLSDKETRILNLQSQNGLLQQKYVQCLNALGIKGALENFQEQLKNPHENP